MNQRRARLTNGTRRAAHPRFQACKEGPVGRDRTRQLLVYRMQADRNPFIKGKGECRRDKVTTEALEVIPVVGESTQPAMPKIRHLAWGYAQRSYLRF